MRWLVIPLLLLSGCTLGRQTENEPLDPELIAGLRPGKTTAREVVEAMGAPTDVVQLGRRSAYLYRHSQSRITGTILVVFNMFNQDERQDRLWVFFDEDGILTHVGSTLQAEDSRFTAPFLDPYDAEEEDEAP